VQTMSYPNEDAMNKDKEINKYTMWGIPVVLLPTLD